MNECGSKIGIDSIIDQTMDANLSGRKCLTDYSFEHYQVLKGNKQ